jgi:glycosyltransferase involved in cell wall biosynthesis/peptidoglycan/xylan/chitin deacetylase (PgdA/CDA1 family)
LIKLSVIIPTYNRRHVLERTLPTLEAQDLPPEDYEVIVVVDGSTDGTQELLLDWNPRCKHRVLETPHSGPSTARNAGINAAVGALVLFLDDDFLCVPDLLRQHVESHVDYESRVVHGAIYVARDSVQSIIRQVTERFYENYYGHLDPEMELHYPQPIGNSIAVLSSLANSSMSRDLLLSTGGYDETIRAAEDLELGLRLWKMGASFRYRPKAIAYEYYVKSSWEFLQWQGRTLLAGDLRACRKHPEYRPHSSLSSFGETRSSKKWLRNLIVRFPLSPLPLLAFPLRFEKWLMRFGPIQKLMVRSMAISERMMRLRSGLKVLGSWNELESQFDRRVPALMYHHIGPLRPGTYPSLTVSPERFEQQVRWLKRRGYVGIKPAEWARWRREGTGLPKKPILITFDDAYADIAEYALPVLKRYGFGGAVFVVSGRVGATNTWDEVNGCGTLKLMTAEQIRYWAREGIEFGAHSQTHADLRSLSPAECMKEVEGSKRDLEALIGIPVTSFAYPFGEYNEDVCSQVRSQFDLGFSMGQGINFLRTDPHLLGRHYIGPNDSLLTFSLCVRGIEMKRFRDLRVKLAVRTRLRKILGLRAVDRAQ